MISKYLVKKNYINFFVIFFIFCLDRISKKYVIYLSNKNLNQELFASKYLNINLIWNEGIAFGLFAFEESSLYNILTIFIALIIIVIFYMVTKSDGFKRYSLPSRTTNWRRDSGFNPVAHCIRCGGPFLCRPLIEQVPFRPARS